MPQSSISVRGSGGNLPREKILHCSKQLILKGKIKSLNKKSFSFVSWCKDLMIPAADEHSTDLLLATAMDSNFRWDFDCECYSMLYCPS